MLSSASGRVSTTTSKRSRRANPDAPVLMQDMEADKHPYISQEILVLKEMLLLVTSILS